MCALLKAAGGPAIVMEKHDTEANAFGDSAEPIVDGEFKSPKPLDRRIATVWLRTPTNNPTDGYDLLLSASFGKERVVLKAGEFEIEVDFSIKTVDIELQFARCTYALSDQGAGARRGRQRSVVDLGLKQR